MKIYLNSNLNLSDTITGSGVDQDVRIYVNNISKNLNDNQEFFEIPSSATEDMFLTYGNFSFSFQNNYTTDYVIEDDDALYADDFISFDFNISNSNITFHDGGPPTGDFNDLTDLHITTDTAKRTRKFQFLVSSNNLHTLFTFWTFD